MERGFGIGLAVAMTAACVPQPISYVTLSGFVVPPISVSLSPLAGARLDVVSLKGDLGKAGAATAADVPGSPGVYSYAVRLDASALPAAPAPFKVALHNPERPPRDGALLSGIVLLFRPPGDLQDLGSFRLDLDATSSLAALGIEYRANLDPDADFSTLKPDRAAKRFERALLTFNFQQAFGSFLAGRTNDAPAASLELAQQASEELPRDLSTL